MRDIVMKLNTVNNTIIKLTNVNPIKGNRNSDIYWWYAPYGSDVAIIKFLPKGFFNETNVNPIPSIKMVQETDEEIILAKIPEGEVETGWSLYYYAVDGGISSILESYLADDYEVSFEQVTVDAFDTSYQGEYATASTLEATVISELNAQFNNPLGTLNDNDFVNVYQTALTQNSYKSWLLIDALAGTWEKQTTLLNASLESNTQPFTETFKGTVFSNDEPLVEGTPTEQALVFNQIYAELSQVSDEINDIKLLLGEQGQNFVKVDLLSNYQEVSSPDSDSVLYLEEATTGDPKRITVANLLESGRSIFIDTFETASGLSCPDPDDLICTYPNGIADPSVRRGWIANVNSTGTVWAWSEVQNQWVNTGQAQADMLNSFYDSTNDPITTANNGQDMGVAHGQAIQVEKDKVVTLQNKTQNFDTNGDIPTGKDVESIDLSTATGGALTALIQALIAEWNRNNTQDTNIQANANDILTKLAKDFSTFTSKSTLSDSDLFALYDGDNKKISWADFKNAIDTNLINDQGWYANIGALRSAIPVGQDGWHATIGDVDTRAVWDSDSNDWIEVASKLYFTETDGAALTVRVGNNESAITALQATIVTKEDVANKVNTRSGNEGSTELYLSVAGIEEYVEPVRIRSLEDRTFNPFIQSVGTTKFVANLNDNEWRSNRIVYGSIENITIQPGQAEISIDGGATFKDLAVVQISSGNIVYVSVDLSVINVFGTRFKLFYKPDIDKVVIFDTNENLARIVGEGWTLDVTLMGESARNDLQDIRLDNIEAGSLGGKAFSIAQISLANPITNIDSGSGWVKVPFGTITITPNDTNVVDVTTVDTSNDGLVVKQNEEPGYEFQGNITVAETGSADVELQAGLFNAADPIIEANLLDQFTVYVDNGNDPQDRSKTIKVSNELLNGLTGGYPVELVVYVRELAGGGAEASVLDFNFTASSLFTGTGVGSSENIILSSPTEETRSGALTFQDEHNKESVNDRKHLLDVNSVKIANDQGSGDFMFASNINLAILSNPTVRTLFTGITSDNEDNVRLSVDNGSNYYDVEFRLTDVDLKVKHVRDTHVFDLYFTGVKFIATYVDSPIENQNIPYIGDNSFVDGAKGGLPVTIEEAIPVVPTGIEGVTFAQILSDGNAETSLISDDSGTIIETISSGGWVFGNTSYSPTDKTFQIENGAKYFVKFKLKDTSIGDLRDFIRFRYSDDTEDTVGTNTNGFKEFYGIITATKSLLANIKMTEGNAGLLDRDYQYIVKIPTEWATYTADQINNLLGNRYLDNKLHSLAEAVEVNQLVDKRNKYGNATTNDGTVIDIGNGVYYVEFEADGTQKDLILPCDWDDNETYTLLAHYFDNNLVGGTGLKLDNGEFGGVADIEIAMPSEKNADAIATLFQSGTVASDFAQFFVSSTTTSGTIKANFFIAKGDLTWLTKDQIIQLVQEQIFGTFNLQYLNITSTDKNKLDYTNDFTPKDSGVEYRLIDNGIQVETVSVGTFDFVEQRLKLIEGKQYTLSALINVVSGSDGGRIAIFSTDGDNFGALTVSGGEVTFTPTTEETRFLFYSSVSTSELQIKEYTNIQVELGTVATEYEAFNQNTYTLVPDTPDGLGSVPNGAHDTETMQETKPYVLQASDITAIANGTNIQRIQIPLSAFNGLKTYTAGNVDGNFIIQGFPNEIASNILVNGNPGDFETGSADLFLGVPLGTYATLLDAQNDLAGTSLRYELDEYLPRNEINQNEVTQMGGITTSKEGTYVQSTANGVKNEFKATSAVNTKAQPEATKDFALQLSKENQEQQAVIDKLQTEVNVLNNLKPVPLLSDVVSISDATTRPGTPNAELNESQDEYDALRVEFGFVGGTVGVYSVDITLDNNGDLTGVSAFYGVSAGQQMAFFVYRNDADSLTVYYASIVTTTYGSPANVVRTANANLEIKQIYGIKY